MVGMVELKKNLGKIVVFGLCLKVVVLVLIENEELLSGELNSEEEGLCLYYKEKRKLREDAGK